MNEKNVMVGELEDEFYAEIARRVIIQFSQQDKTVQLMILVAQLEQAKKILERKFI